MEDEFFEIEGSRGWQALFQVRMATHFLNGERPLSDNAWLLLCVQALRESDCTLCVLVRPSGTKECWPTWLDLCCTCGRGDFLGVLNNS